MMDMRTEFTIVIDGDGAHDKFFSWQEGLEFYLECCEANGFEIDPELKQRLITMAKLRKIEF